MPPANEILVHLMDPKVFMASAVKTIESPRLLIASIELRGKVSYDWTVTNGKIPFIANRYVFEMHRREAPHITSYVYMLMMENKRTLEVVQLAFTKEGEDDFENKYIRTEHVTRSNKSTRTILRFS